MVKVVQPNFGVARLCLGLVLFFVRAHPGLRRQAPPSSSSIASLLPQALSTIGLLAAFLSFPPPPCDRHLSPSCRSVAQACSLTPSDPRQTSTSTWLHSFPGHLDPNRAHSAHGHGPKLSISDPNHHVTEAIGDMYGDINYTRRDSRPLSYVASPHDTLVTSPKSPGSSHSADNGPPSKRVSLTPADAATSHFPLNDVDYESSPAAVAQEMVNLQALRRMSMVDHAAADPDLPSYNASLTMAPTGADDEDDASRLFWVPARIHPELAPKEFKTFLETRVDQIKRRSGDEDMLLPIAPGRQDSGGGLRRKKSMLSRQIDTSAGLAADAYRDGADALREKRSVSAEHAHELTVADFQDLNAPTHEPAELVDRLSLDRASPAMEEDGEHDVPILPAAPPGKSLRRSTHTNYRRGSLRKGERVPYSKRVARNADDESPVTSPTGSIVSLPLARTQTEPTPPLPQDELPENFSRPVRPGRRRASQPALESPDDRAAPPANFTHRTGDRRPSHDPTVPIIVETPPAGQVEEDGSLYQSQVHIPERVSSHDPPPLPGPQSALPPAPHRGGRSSARGAPVRQAQNARASTQTLSDIVGQPSPLPGNSTRTDSLSFIPTFNEEKKDRKKKDGEGKKSSWGWLLGNEEKDKDKDREEKTSKKGKTKGGKANDNTRLDLLQTSIDGGRGRESLVLDRENVKLEEERKRESSRKSSDSKKDKDSLFSSLFGGSKKRGERESTVKRDRSSRRLSPEPPFRQLQPDVDYNWTRFSILEERAIYRMAHIKLANPRRALYSQVLLSNFMYSYLAKVQQMHPQVQIPQEATQKQQRQQQGLHPQGQSDVREEKEPDYPYYDYPEVTFQSPTQSSSPSSLTRDRNTRQRAEQHTQKTTTIRTVIRSSSNCNISSKTTARATRIGHNHGPLSTPETDAKDGGTGEGMRTGRCINKPTSSTSSTNSTNSTSRRTNNIIIGREQQDPINRCLRLNTSSILILTQRCLHSP